MRQIYFCLSRLVLIRLFCTAIRRDSVSLWRFPLLSHVPVFWWEISVVCGSKYPWNCFHSHFCFLVIVVLLIIKLFVLSLVVVISVFLFFLCSFRIIVSIYRHYIQCWRYLFLLLFLIHRASLYHLWDVRKYASSWVFLFSGSFVKFLPTSTSRMLPSILQRGQPSCSSVWWDFCFREVFSFSWDTNINFFSISAWSSIPIFPIACNFLRFFSISSVICRFLLLIICIAHDFLCQIAPLCILSIYSLPVLGFPIIFHFLQTVWFRPCTIDG